MSKHEWWRTDKMSDHGSENIPVDEFYADYSDGESYRTVASTVHDYQYENGRRYHAYSAGTYPFPNDLKSGTNELIAHHLFLRILDDQLYLAPIESPQRIVDLGTGTGKWAEGMADRFESATVLGIDLSPQHDEYVQPNLSFEVDNVQNEWPPREPFDFVHLRSLYGSIFDWPAVYAECFKNMTANGYVEQVDIILRPFCNDGSMAPDSIFRRWEDLSEEFSRATGKVFANRNTQQQMLDAGFEDIVEKTFKIPLGPWSIDERYREIGKWFEHFWITGMQGWILAPATRVLKWTEQQVNDFLLETQKGLGDRKQHIYYQAVVTYARKP